MTHQTTDMNEKLAEKLKALRLGGLLAHWDDYLKTAAKKRFSHGRMLTHIIDEEYRIKRENACRLRLKHARIPEPFEMETFPFAKQKKLNRKMILALYDSLEYMSASRVWPPAFLPMPSGKDTPDATCSSPN